MVDQAQIFENMQATAFGEAIMEAQMNTARDTICNFLKIEKTQTNPDSGDLDVLTFEQAYSMLIKEGYLLNTYIKPVGNKMVFHADIFQKTYGEAIEVRTGFSVELVPYTPEETPQEEPVDAQDIPE